MFEPDNFFANETNLKSGYDVEEIMVDHDAQDRHGVLIEKVSSSLGMKLMSTGLILGLAVLGIRLYDLQLARGSDYRLAAEDNRIRVVQKFAPRGQILDRNGKVIARSVPSFELVIIPHDLPQDENIRNALILEISAVSNIVAEEVENMIANTDPESVNPVPIVQGLNQEQALKLEEIIARFTGVLVQSSPVREYVNGPAFAHLIGYAGKLTREEWEKHKNDRTYAFNDTIGKTGLEYVYEKVLRGVHGGTEVEVDASGKVTKKLRDIAPKSGPDLKLTIDSDLQNEIYRLLGETMRKFPSSTGAAAVALDPRTGEVLSLVSLPTYDNNMFTKGIKNEDYQKLVNDKSRPMLNRVISGVYPPGSTIKPVMAAAALQEGVINESTKIEDKGFIQVGNFTFYGWDRSGLGVLNVVGAIAQSSDPFFYIVGGGHESTNIKGLGEDRIANYFNQFHLGSDLNINLLGEASGLVPTPEWKKQRFAGTQEQEWYLGNTYHMSIGQGDVLATPLQVAGFTAAFANWGKIMKPVLTDREEKNVATEVKVDSKNLEIVRRALRENVVSGSGVRLSNLPIEAAGKTGTAQFDARDLSRTHAWYTAFAPYHNPEIVITVLIEAGGEGHAAAVPVVYDALKWWSENRMNK